MEALVAGLAVGALTLRVAFGLTSGPGAELSVLAAPGLVLVVRVIFLVLLPQPLCFLDEGPLVALVEEPLMERRNQDGCLLT